MFACQDFCMQAIKEYLKQRDTIVFFFCLAVISGPAISVLFENNLEQFPDCKSYIGLFHFDFEQNPVRRYRFIVPFTARLLDFLFHSLFDKLAPGYYKGDFSTAFSFFVLNSALVAISGVFIYRYCRAYKAGILGSIIGLLVFLTGRYTIYFAAIPMVDALYFMVLVMAVLGIKTQNSKLIVWAIFLGPFAKEAFIFIAPVIFFFSHMPKMRLLLYFFISGLLVFSSRYAIDMHYGFHALSGLHADVAHVWGLKYLLARIFSFYGLYKIFINICFWLLVPIFAAWLSLSATKHIFRKFENYIWWFLAAVLIQMILSSAVERMFYLAMPVICLIIALAADIVLKKLNVITPERSLNQNL